MGPFLRATKPDNQHMETYLLPSSLSARTASSHVHNRASSHVHNRTNARWDISHAPDATDHRHCAVCAKRIFRGTNIYMAFDQAHCSNVCRERAVLNHLACTSR